MIRYSITEAKLRARIEAYRPGWLDRAKVKTEDNEKAAHPEFPGLWSEIKQVYIDLQHSKCAFCEKPLEGRIEQDVEHFRPKAKVAVWKPSQKLIDEGLVLNELDDGTDEAGYRMLAYHPLNYAMSCKTCNSVFKRNMFRPSSRESRMPKSRRALQWSNRCSSIPLAMPMLSPRT